MNINIPIYMDYSATTPVDERVADKMVAYMTRQGKFGNPASRSHTFGWQAEEAIDEARDQDFSGGLADFQENRPVKYHP